VSPDLPSAFAHSAASGDITAAILALLALILLPSASGVVTAWIFNIWGSADILNAFYQANHAGLIAGQLGAAFFLPTVIVPLLLITHGLAFRILLQDQPKHNAEIASQSKMARRTVKAHFNRLFLRFGITGGVKRVKLAALLYRRQACL
jgi:DNA-binding CsgD family transcriptional regulator